MLTLIHELRATAFDPSLSSTPINHTNFTNPVSSQSSGNFGKITATVGSATATAVGTTAGVLGGGPRVAQGGLRLEF